VPSSNWELSLVLTNLRASEVHKSQLPLLWQSEHTLHHQGAARCDNKVKIITKTLEKLTWPLSMNETPGKRIWRQRTESQ
jgi:hypothetical protein